MTCVACDREERGPPREQPGHEAWLLAMAEAGWFLWDTRSRIVWHGVALCPTCAATPVGRALAQVHKYDLERERHAS